MTNKGNGMNIKGSGGKGGGGAGKEAPNTLRSSARVKFVQILSEGPVQGTRESGLKSFYFNNTPLVNEDGSFNLPGGENGELLVEFLKGDSADQTLPGFPEAMSVKAVNVVVPGGSSVTQSVDSDVDSILLTVQLPNGLFETNNGQINGTQVQFRVERKPQNSTSWEIVHDVSLNDKTMSVYEKDYKVDRPDSGAWDVRVFKVTPDSQTLQKKNTLKFERFTEVQYKNIKYENACALGVRADAQSTGGQVPIISVDLMGLRIQVPKLYDGLNRKYPTATWNGVFDTELKYTDNPAWVLYSLLTNERWGLGSVVKDFMVDKSSFFMAAQYCDERVPIGDGSEYAPGVLKVEPRFSFNGQIFKQENAIKVLNAVASSMRATVVVQNGLIKLSQDRPSSKVLAVTNANVKDGRFTYQGTDSMQRFSAADITYHDVQDNFLENIIHHEDPQGIIRYGYNAIQEQAFGCTSKGQALRHARWAVDSSLHQTETVSFTGTLDLVGLEVGDVIEIQDNHKHLGTGGRVLSNTANTLKLDRKIKLSPGTKITVNVPFMELHPVLTSGETDEVQVQEVLPELQNRTPFSATEQSSLYRVMAISSTEPHELEFNCLAYDPMKYARVELGADFVPPLISRPQADRISGATNITFLPQVRDDGLTSSVYILVSWDQHPDEHFMTFKFRHRKDGGTWSAWSYSNQNSTEIQNAVQGAYEFEIMAMNWKGVLSPTTIQTYHFQYSNTTALLAPIALFLQEGTGVGDLFTGKDLHIQWVPNPVNDSVPFEIVGGYEISIEEFKGTTTTVATYKVPASETKFSYLHDENNRNGLKRSLVVRVRTLDGFGNTSSNSIGAWFHNPAPGVPNIKLTPGYDVVFAEFSLPADDNDFMGYKVFASTDKDFVPDDRKPEQGGNLVYKGRAEFCSFAATANATYYVKAVGFDGFTEDIRYLNMSATQKTTVRGIVDLNEYSLQGIKFFADPELNTVNWTGGTIAKTSGTTQEQWQIAPGSHQWSSGTMFVYWREHDTTFKAASSLQLATHSDGRLLATYKGGTQLSSGNGDFFVDGANIYAQTIGATNLVTGSAVITGHAQMGEATIHTAAIRDLAVTDAKIVELSVDKLRAGSINVNEFIQSQDYAPGSSGWRINGDGTAEFGSASVRGNITAKHLDAATGSFTGELRAATGTFSGTLSAPNIVGGTIQGTAIYGTTLSGGTVNGASFTGGSININDKFIVNSQGDVIARSLEVQVGKTLASGEVPEIGGQFVNINDYSVGSGDMQYWVQVPPGSRVDAGTFYIDTGYDNYEDIFNSHGAALVPRVVCTKTFFSGGTRTGTLYHVEANPTVTFNLGHYQTGSYGPPLGRIFIKVPMSIINVRGDIQQARVASLKWSLLKVA